MEKKKRFFECLLPVSSCNLCCEYCYVIQQGRRRNKIDSLDYPIETIIKALNKQRLGGKCYFSICAIGETLLPPYIVPLVEGLLKEGHYVNLTTNGTISQRFDEFCKFDKNLLKHLHFSFSFHFLELKNKNLINTFFANIKKIQSAGCSFIVKLNLCDSYIPYFEEIKNLCLKNVNALPVLAITRKQDALNFEFYTNKSKEEYIDIGKSFNSKMFDFTVENFNKKQKKFCYAGDWSCLLNLKTGIITKCYSNAENGYDICKNIDEPIPFEAVGKHCKNKFCQNSEHFLVQGTIPSIKCPGYAEIRCRDKSWYAKEMYDFLNQKLYENNKQYSLCKKIKINSKYRIQSLKLRLSKIKHKFLK